jgi:FlaA1/EpsC-like NDP-sugar epimerase
VKAVPFFEQILYLLVFIPALFLLKSNSTKQFLNKREMHRTKTINLSIRKIITKDMFENKILLITGGTGSFGNAVLRRFLDTDIKEIRIFSRDEKKQDDMRHLYQNPKIKFYIGDVRNRKSVDVAMIGVDYVFHAAALKQVPSCEFFPVEAVRTNVLGAENY